MNALLFHQDVRADQQRFFVQQTPCKANKLDSVDAVPAYKSVLALDGHPLRRECPLFSEPRVGVRLFARAAADVSLRGALAVPPEADDDISDVGHGLEGHDGEVFERR